MLSITELRLVLAQITYRPHWTFTVYETPAQGVWLLILAEVEDSYHPGQMVPLRIKSPLPPFASGTDFLVWLRWRLERIEIHECHEWLKVGGVPVWNPHADDADEPA